MKLPPEMLDEIIGHIPTYYTQHLRTCSLVATSWIYPSQKRLFETVHIHPGNLQGWLDCISPANTALLGHIRLLSYHEKEYTVFPAKRSIGPAYDVLCDYFPSFRQLRLFTLCFAHIPWGPQQIELFSAFQHTFSHVSLSGCSVTKNALITIINYFPHLSCFHLCRPDYHREDEPSPSLRRLSLKKLHVTECSGGTLDLLGEMSKLGLNFEEVVLHSMTLTSSWPEFLEYIIGAFGKTTKRMRIMGYPQEDTHSLMLSHCQKLRELEVYMPRANDAELNLISSITSTKIEKIILTCSPAFGLSASDTYWTRLDEMLVELAGRSKRKLEMEFRSVSDGKLVTVNYLPKFRGKGRVVVFGGQREMIHCSD